MGAKNGERARRSMQDSQLGSKDEMAGEDAPLAPPPGKSRAATAQTTTRLSNLTLFDPW